VRWGELHNVVQMTAAFLMSHSVTILVVALLLFLAVSEDGMPSPPSAYPVDEHIFHAVVDHYSFRPTPEPTFPLCF
jgi:hypothetical protein